MFISYIFKINTFNQNVPQLSPLNASLLSVFTFSLVHDIAVFTDFVLFFIVDLMRIACSINVVVRMFFSANNADFLHPAIVFTIQWFF